MLSFPEEIFLLALDDATGKVVIPAKEVVLSSALVGAALAELSFLRKIDTDLDNLYIVDASPIGNTVLDGLMETLVKTVHQKGTIHNSLKALMPRARNVEVMTLSALVEKGILKEIGEKIFWFFPTRRYPIIDGQEMLDVERRLRNIILTDEIPSPRDAALISLVHACDLFREILSPKEFRRAAAKIEEFAKMDRLGHEVMRLINQTAAVRANPANM
jgi:hypothetical protein